MRRILAILFLAAGLAAADRELALVGGGKVKGELVSENEQQVLLRRRTLTPTGIQVAEIAYPRSSIADIREVPSPLDEYATRSAKIADNAMSHAALASWCIDNCLEEQAVAHAIKAEKLEPPNPFTARIMERLRYIRVDGAWVKESVHLAKQGQVRVGKEVLTREEAARRSNLARAQLVRDQAAAAVAEKEKLAAEANPEGIKKQEALVARLVEQAKSAQARVEAADKALADYDKRPRSSTSNADQAARERARRTALAKQASEAREKVDQTAQEQRAAQARLATLSSSASSIATELAAAKERLAKAEAALAQAAAPDTAAKP